MPWCIQSDRVAMKVAWHVCPAKPNQDDGPILHAPPRSDHDGISPGCRGTQLGTHYSISETSLAVWSFRCLEFPWCDDDCTPWKEKTLVFSGDSITSTIRAQHDYLPKASLVAWGCIFASAALPGGQRRTSKPHVEMESPVFSASNVMSPKLKKRPSILRSTDDLPQLRESCFPEPCKILLFLDPSWVGHEPPTLHVPE